MRHTDEEVPASSVRGRLCDILLPALATEQHDALLRRLGEKATLDEPFFGASAGLEQLKPHLQKLKDWLVERAAKYEPMTTILGNDHDVAEGTLELRANEEWIQLPIAVVMERKRAREVAVRLHCGTMIVQMARNGPSVPQGAVPAVPPQVSEQLRAFAMHDVFAMLAGFESAAVIRDAANKEHSREMWAELMARHPQGPLTPFAVADDGRTCAVEASREGRTSLIVVERSDSSGLFKALRLYTDQL